jgi:general L-amino acid transport system substrate-binding protein
MFMRWLILVILLLTTSPAFAKPLSCFGVVAPGLAYPDVAGAWHGLEIDLCQKLGSATGVQAVFSPVLQDSDVPPPAAGSVAFLPEGDIPAGYVAGPVIFDDNQALMVPAGSKARTAAGLANRFICVEPGSPEDFNLTAYFAAHKIPLREFVFQETDEMHDAYVAGRCDAITARISLLRGLRANEDGARRDDVILPDNLGDNPVRVATPSGMAPLAKQIETIIQEQANDAASHP